MNNKYYTPELSEIHAGLRYVWFSHLTGKHENKVFEFNDMLTWGEETIQFDLDARTFTVKHLDRQDIEELGWEFTSETKTHGIIFYGFRKFLDFYPETNIVCINNCELYEDYKCWFEGEIKNINELQKVMKQIKIG